MKQLLVVVLVALLATSLCVADEAKSLKAPDFTLTDVNGKTHSLKDYKGKTVVLEWTNYHCPFVKKHYNNGDMQKLQKDYTAKGIVWLSICSSAPGKQGSFSEKDASGKEVVSKALVSAAMKERKAVPTAYLIDADGKVGKLYDAKTTPHMFVIDKDGNFVYQGAIDSIRSWKSEDVAKATNFVKKVLDGAKVENTQPYGCSVKY